MTMGRRVGEVAASTGLTVRSLHYYEEIGLVVASARTEAGHRLYSADDVARLYRMLRLRELGLSLAEIADALDDPDWDLRGALDRHVRDLAGRLATEQRLQQRLQSMLTSLQTNAGGLTEDLLTILEDMTMLDSNIQTRISTLVYADPGGAVEYLERVFGFGPSQVTHDSEGRVVHAEIRAGDGLVWLHPESAEFRLASPQTVGSATACVSVIVEDVDEHFEGASAENASIIYPPIDQPYGYREYSARDLEGHLWSFMKPLE